VRCSRLCSGLTVRCQRPPGWLASFHWLPLTSAMTQMPAHQYSPIRPMQLQQVYAVNSQPLQAAIYGRRYVGCVQGRRSAPQPGHAAWARHFGGNDVCITGLRLLPEPGAKDLLRPALQQTKA